MFITERKGKWKGKNQLDIYIVAVGWDNDQTKLKYHLFLVRHAYCSWSVSYILKNHDKSDLYISIITDTN